MPLLFTKAIFLPLTLLCNQLSPIQPSQKNTEKNIFEITKVTSYHGNDLETAYRIACKNSITKKVRFFEIIKSDQKMKNHFIADFLLVEKSITDQKMIYYPTGWESLKAVDEQELKETCLLVIQGAIPSYSFHN